MCALTYLNPAFCSVRFGAHIERIGLTEKLLQLENLEMEFDG